MPDDLPYLRFKPPLEVPPKMREGGGFPAPKAKGPSRSQQWGRLGPALGQLQQSLQQRAVELSATAPGAAAEEVLVFELAHSVPEFFEAVRNTPGMEWLAAAEEEIDPEDARGFVSLDSHQMPDPTRTVAASLYLVSSNAVSLQQILTAWERKSRKVRLTGNLSKFGSILDHVIDVRRWDTSDRLKVEDIQIWETFLPEDNSPFRFEIELWFRGATQARNAAERRIQSILSTLEGRILTRFQHEGCRYHGLCVEMPSNRVRSLLQHPEASELLKDETIFHLWLVGQAVASPHDEEDGEQGDELYKELPVGEPEIALFDGMPVENHPQLAGRLRLHDPDGFGDDYPVAQRNHGTSMASIIVHGDLQSNGQPLSRPLYVRPIMRPTPGGNNEHIPDDHLPLDLIQRAVVELQREAPSVKVVNLSIGDEARPFAGSMSAWARMLDWLQSEYNLLFIVSAGNTYSIRTNFDSSTAFEDAAAKEVERDVVDSKWFNGRDSRILSPSESLNALCIGSTSADGGGVLPTLPFDTRHPSGSNEIPSHSSCIGPGFRKSVKPDFLTHGGRQLVRWMNRGDGPITEPILMVSAPGIKAAAPPAMVNTNRLIYTRGTSAAAALATRRCAKIFDAIRTMDADTRPDEEFYAVLVKALAVHAACWRDADSYLQDLLPLRRSGLGKSWKKRFVCPLVGYGTVAPNELMLGHDGKVTVIAWGSITPGTTLQYSLPIPASLHGLARGKKRLTCTTAWFTPIHPGNARYRRVKLSLLPPSKSENQILGANRRNGDSNAAQRGTVHHEVFEGQTVRGQTQEEPRLPLLLSCTADAGEWDQPVRYGIAVTLEVAVSSFGRIYEEVRNKLDIRVPVRPS